VKKLCLASSVLVVGWLVLAGCSGGGDECLQANGLKKQDLGCAGISYSCEVDSECPSGLVCVPGSTPHAFGSQEHPADCIKPVSMGHAGSG
jgi:hypothetical protein